MKYEARPIQKNKETLKAESYESIIRVAKAALIQDPSNSGYLIMEHVATLTTQVSVAVECHNNVDKGKSSEVELLFDPKPDDIPEPPEGFLYFGKKPIYAAGQRLPETSDIANYAFGSPWDTGFCGDGYTGHYAVKIGSEAFFHAQLAHEQGKPIIINQTK